MNPKSSDKKPRRTTPRRHTTTVEHGDEPEPRPAFRPFELEKDWVGKNLMRTMAMLIYGGEHAPDWCRDMAMLYSNAIGKPAPWHCTYDKKGRLISQEKHVPIPPHEAAEELIKLALDAAAYVELLHCRAPELCRQVAVRLPHWPIKADLTAKDWKREGETLIADIGLGSGIEGFLKSARTSDENPIRLYATAIYEALHGTRFEFKEIGNNKYRTAAGCPEWAQKTLELPMFTRSGVSAWMKVGKEMLLEQRPDFLNDPLLKEQSFKWKKRASNRSRSGKPTLRSIQNEAFGDFAKEMKNLAPVENVYRGKW
ncbi:MAG: hypothetical protein V4584_00255 [Verrucomicrobiota bacterium]